MASTWFSAFNGDDDDTGFITAPSLRRQARRHFEEQTFSFREERRRVDLNRISLRDELGSSLLASRVSVGRDSRRIDISTPAFASRDFVFPPSPPAFRRGRRVEVEEASTSSSNNKAETSELTDIRQSLRDIKDENQKLQAVVNDVMEVNKRWQRHHSEREIYVQKLLNTIAELQQKVSVTRSSELPSSKEQRVSGVTASTERLAQLEADNAQLRLDLESARRKVQALEQEHKEHAELLGIQVRSYKDDWEAERREKDQLARDKLAAEERTRDLQTQVATLQKKLHEKAVYNISTPPHRCCPLHLCESSSAPVVSSSHCCGSSPKSTTFRTSVHLPCGPSVNQLTLREPRLPENLALDSCPSRVSSLESTYSTVTLDSGRDSPSDKSDISEVKTSPITIGFEDGLASVQSFSFAPAESSKLSVFEIAAPPVIKDRYNDFKDWSNDFKDRSNDFKDQSNDFKERSNETKERSNDFKDRFNETKERSNEPKSKEEGILTQTRDNISCPRCGQIFPPEKHIKFLDHFEECHDNFYNPSNTSPDINKHN